MKLLDRVIKRLKRGDVVHMQLFNGVREWWFEQPRLDVDNSTMVVALASVPDVVEFGDSLFGLRNNSQTYQKAKGERQ